MAGLLATDARASDPHRGRVIVTRLMGLDHGRKRIGVAVSDPLGIVARPVTIIVRASRREDFAELARIIDAEGVSRIVVGLPTDAESGIGIQAAKVIRWARKLHAAVDRAVSLWDESYSSEAAAELAARGKRKPGDPVDDIAAAIILQDYLDAGGITSEPGQPLDAFAHIE
ncbi:MAG: Holliday junction resolvase RuvX [Chloroflexi bacterium]|nr:Holliday junction resolvase RuvX [Chloroflexota bacterium]